MIIRKVEKKTTVKPKRAVAYIRTSTRRTTQAESYETQYKVYRDMIEGDETLSFSF